MPRVKTHPARALTTGPRQKTGAPIAFSHIPLGRGDGMPTDCAVNLDHVQTVSRSKIGPLIATLSVRKLAEIRQGLLFSLGF